MAQRFAVTVQQGVALAAGLGALAAVAAAPAQGIAQIALPAVTDAQRAVDEGLQLQAGLRADLSDLRQGQLARQDGALEADLFQEGHPFRGVVVHLRAGKQRQGRQLRFQQPDILDDQGVHPGLVQLVSQRSRLRQFFIIQQGVERGIHPGAVAVGVLCQRFDVLQRISGCLARPEAAGADIDGVRAAVDGRHPALQAAGRGKQFNSLHNGLIIRCLLCHFDPAVFSEGEIPQTWAR